MIPADLQATAIQAVNPRIEIALRRTNAARAPMESTASVGVSRLELAGRIIRRMRATTPMPQLRFGRLNLVDPIFVPFLRDGVPNVVVLVSAMMFPSTYRADVLHRGDAEGAESLYLKEKIKN